MGVNQSERPAWGVNQPDPAGRVLNPDPAARLVSTPALSTGL